MSRTRSMEPQTIISQLHCDASCQFSVDRFFSVTKACVVNVFKVVSKQTINLKKKNKS